MPDALKLASALETFASHIDGTDGARQREVSAQSAARVEKIAAQYRETLGSGFTDVMHAELSKMGSAELDVIEKLAEAHQPPTSLGGAAGGGGSFPSGAGRVDPMAEFTNTYLGPAR
jgi:hypothetical protein